MKISIPLKVLLPNLHCIRINNWKYKNFVTDVFLHMDLVLKMSKLNLWMQNF